MTKITETKKNIWLSTHDCAASTQHRHPFTCPPASPIDTDPWAFSLSVSPLPSFTVHPPACLPPPAPPHPRCRLHTVEPRAAWLKQCRQAPSPWYKRRNDDGERHRRMARPSTRTKDPKPAFHVLVLGLAPKVYAFRQ